MSDRMSITYTTDLAESERLILASLLQQYECAGLSGDPEVDYDVRAIAVDYVLETGKYALVKPDDLDPEADWDDPTDENLLADLQNKHDRTTVVDRYADEAFSSLGIAVTR